MGWLYQLETLSEHPPSKHCVLVRWLYSGLTQPDCQSPWVNVSSTKCQSETITVSLYILRMFYSARVDAKLQMLTQLAHIAEALQVTFCDSRCFVRRVTVGQKVRWKGSSSINHCWCRKTRDTDLWYKNINSRILSLCHKACSRIVVAAVVVVVVVVVVLDSYSALHNSLVA